MRKSSRLLAALLILAAAVSMTGCSLSQKSNATTLAADGEGKLTETIVDTVSEGAYTAEELTEYITKNVEAYNQGGSDVAMDSCEINGDKVTIVMTYKDFRTYSSFNQVPCFIGTIREAEDAGYPVLSNVFKDKSGNAADMKVISERQKEWKVMVLAETMDVRTSDKILYASENVDIKGRTNAEITSVMKQSTDPVEEVASASAAEEDAQQTQNDNSGVNPYATVYEEYAYIIFK
ncbi:MAG: hypothetical protein Q4B22_07825 [Eubacteriales bacterium]|nr:hypothetical protein [Eubacteriales bacterium]